MTTRLIVLIVGAKQVKSLQTCVKTFTNRMYVVCSQRQSTPEMASEEQLLDLPLLCRTSAVLWQRKLLHSSFPPLPPAPPRFRRSSPDMLTVGASRISNGNNNIPENLLEKRYFGRVLPPPPGLYFPHGTRGDSAEPPPGGNQSQQGEVSEVTSEVWRASALCGLVASVFGRVVCMGVAVFEATPVQRTRSRPFVQSALHVPPVFRNWPSKP